jgi:hypothetical protein
MQLSAMPSSPMVRRLAGGKQVHFDNLDCKARDDSAAAGHRNAPLFAREIYEAALAHIDKDRTVAASRRGDLFEKRRELVAARAGFVEDDPGGMVVAMRRS